MKKQSFCDEPVVQETFYTLSYSRGDEWVDVASGTREEMKKLHYKIIEEQKGIPHRHMSSHRVLKRHRIKKEFIELKDFLTQFDIYALTSREDVNQERTTYIRALITRIESQFGDRYSVGEVFAIAHTLNPPPKKKKLDIRCVNCQNKPPMDRCESSGGECQVVEQYIWALGKYPVFMDKTDSHLE